jgi:hypothetical protein
MKIKIYCLYNPEECKIKYIGRTKKKKLEHRLIEHITKARYYEKYFPGQKFPHKVNWIKSLLKKGIEPKIKLLTEIEGWKESHIFERNLINKYKDKFNLTNALDRGENNQNMIVSDESKKKISNTLKKFYLNNTNSKSKKIDVFDLQGNKIETYDSIRKFSLEKNLNYKKISELYRGIYKQYKGYRIKLHSKNIKKIEPFIKTKAPSNKMLKIVQYTNLKTGETKEIKGMKECSLQLGFPFWYVTNAIKKYNGINGGYKFILVQFKSEELLENQAIDNQQPSL